MNRTLAALSMLTVAFASPSLLAQDNPAAKLPSGFGDTASNGSRIPVDLSAQLAEIIAKGDNPPPGIAAVIIDRDGVVARGVAGVRKAGGTVPVTINDKWHLGSCTKAMTGTLAALLVSDGTLQWDSSIGDVFNPLRDEKSKITNNWRLCTLRELTTCTANVPTDLGEYGGRPLWSNLWDKARAKVPPRQQRAYLFDELVKSNIGTPGYGFQYANASVALAGYMEETAAKTDYETLITQRLFAPLGMTSAGFGAPGTVDAETEDQPWGHTASGKAMPPGVNADNPASIAPAGTVHMSIEDWGRFARMHLIGAEITLPHPIDWSTDEVAPEWNPKDTLGLGPADFAVLHAPGLSYNDYAAGWIITDRPAWAKGTKPGSTGRCLTHVGSNTMWTAAIWIAPEIDRAFLVCVNTGTNAGGDAREAALIALINLDRKARNLPPIKP